MIISTFIKKSNPYFKDKNEQRLKIIVLSINRIKDGQFIYTFDV